MNPGSNPVGFQQTWTRGPTRAENPELRVDTAYFASGSLRHVARAQMGSSDMTYAVPMQMGISGHGLYRLRGGYLPPVNQQFTD